MADDDTDRVIEKAEQAEEDRIARRYREARDAGWERVDAHAFSLSGRDISELRRLVRGGCPVEFAVRILAADT